MSLDHRLASAARHVAGGVVPPEVDLDVVRARARSNRRRTVIQVVAASVVAVIAVGTAVGSQTLGLPQPATPATSPAPSPSEESTTRSFSPESMTPEVVVNSARAQLQVVGVAPGNADIRMAIWSLAGYRGMALTADGFRTVTYAAVPEEASRVIGSPKDGVFLLADMRGSTEWLVDVNGEVREVTPETSEFVPADPRLWYQCNRGPWRALWCSLDLKRATTHLSSMEWEGSAVRPGLGAQPWGAHPEPRAASTTGRLEAWWYDGGVRQVRTVANAREGDYILGVPPGQMAFWAAGSSPATIDVHTSSADGTGWAMKSYAAPELGQSGYRVMTRLTDGAFLLCTSGDRVVVSRADAAGGAFRQVYQSPSLGAEPCAGLAVQGGFMALSTGDVAAVSRDSGRTWTTVETWR